MELNTAADALAALGQPTRLALTRVLLAAGPSGLPAGEVAARLGVPASTLSFHLRALEQIGLIRPTRQGRSLLYAAQIARLRELLAFLVETCCGGDPALCGDLGRFLAAPAPENPEMTPATTPGVYHALFLCTRNSARSIMAEAILNRIGEGRFLAFSAGSAPSETGPLPEVLSQLKALGHDVSALRCKSWDEFAAEKAPHVDFAVTLCDTLAGQTCPDFGETTITAAWPLPDPAKFAGSAAERATLLNELYAALHRRLSIFIELPIAALDRMALRSRLDQLAHPPEMAR